MIESAGRLTGKILPVHNRCSDMHWQAVPPIHIIVKNGYIKRSKGLLQTRRIKTWPNLRASGVSGSFSVTRQAPDNRIRYDATDDPPQPDLKCDASDLTETLAFPPADSVFLFDFNACGGTDMEGCSGAGAGGFSELIVICREVPSGRLEGMIPITSRRGGSRIFLEWV